MKTWIKYIPIILLLFVILIVSIHRTYESFYGFYYEDGKYTKTVPQKVTEYICNLKPVVLFTSYTGFDTGYGFFAPNVASDFILMFELKDSCGITTETRIMPNFKCKESIVRFSTATSLFLDKVSKNNISHDYSKLLDIIIREIAIHIKESNETSSSIDVSLYLYDYPRIKECKSAAPRENLILIEKYNL